MKKKILKIKFFYNLYKLLKIFKNNKPSHYYAEFAEDVFTDRILRNLNNGFYVDVGCYHPFKGSLTYRLYKRNWNGLNLDISKTSIDLFNISRNKDLNLNLAVTNFDGETFYYENSSINQQNSLIRLNENQKKIKIKCNTLNTIFEKNNVKNIDYLNVDVEGTELKVVEGINLQKYKPKLISIENNNLLIEDYLKSNIYKILVKNNYVFINKIGVTNFFITKELSKNFLDLIKI
ncbi:FkbM family methyltransferase [Candidatus Pelagibacter sp.]|uniref:FkbM family methyltransferase n=1 Tax=Candidatus Pelagibacter sp. TaxID=2024849 RepID=UPI003F82A870